MTGPQHYREAERQLGYANEIPVGENPTGEQYHLLCAQVHATLALAAATAVRYYGASAGSDYGKVEP